MMRDLPVNTSIVRIYRRKQGRKPVLVRIVEEAGVAGMKGFTSLEELWGILSGTQAWEVFRRTASGA